MGALLATWRERKNGTFEFVIRRKRLLPKPIYLTFVSVEAGQIYCEKLEAQLDLGIIPDEFKPSQRSSKLAVLIRRYVSEHTPNPDDIAKLNYVTELRSNVVLSSLDYEWAESFVATLKRERKLSPSTVRKYVGAMARCLDWAQNRGDILDNPFRRLPKGYATYSAADIEYAGIERVDEARDVRLHAGDEARILAVLAGKSDSYALLFRMALETAMRLSEMLTLTGGQLDVRRRTIFLDKTKNGDKRQVPMTSLMVELVQPYHDSDAALFPWPVDTKTALKKTSATVSKFFSRAFTEAGRSDLTFHDLRHEATSRLYERTTLTDLEVAKITGHKTLRTLMRYANLRGSDLADRLW